MGLDLEATARQVQSLATGMREQVQDKRTRLNFALDTMGKAQQGKIERKYAEAQGRVTWLIAGLPRDLREAHSPPETPEDYIALAADGSSIDAERDSPAHCYLINIGTALLQYGSHSRASLQSKPALYVQEEDLAIKDPRGTRAELIEGNVLAAKRMVQEMEALLSVVHEMPVDVPIVALLDGSLILWGLLAAPDFVQEELIRKGAVRVLDGLRSLSQGRRLAVGAYLSLPRSTDVVNALRLDLCPFEPADCDRRCGAKPVFHRECDGVHGVLDRELFEGLLKPGQRSAIFSSRSSVVLKQYGDHQISFFYVNNGDEIVRVELPQWVAQDDALVGLLHSCILDQSRKGRGYPEVLTEAHEQAVIHERDRQLFWQIVEEAVASEGLPTASSEKSRAKRLPWV